MYLMYLTKLLVVPLGPSDENFLDKQSQTMGEAMFGCVSCVVRIASVTAKVTISHFRSCLMKLCS